MIFEAVMELIQQIMDGDASLYDIIPFGGIEVPTVTYTDIDADGNEIETIEYDFANATADREYFTEAECNALETAFKEAYESVMQYDEEVSEWDAYYSSSRGV